MNDIEKLKKQAILSLYLNADTKPQVNTKYLNEHANSIKRYLASGKSLKLIVLENEK
jgi:hypothetical protein